MPDKLCRITEILLTDRHVGLRLVVAVVVGAVVVGVIPYTNENGDCVFGFEWMWMDG